MTSFRDLENPDNAETIRLSIQDAYDRIEWSPEELGLPVEYESIHLDRVEDISDIRVVDARRLPNERFLVGIESRLVCNFNVLIHKRDYPVVEDDPKLYIVNPFWTRHYMSGEIDLHFQANINLVIENLDTLSFDIRVLSVQPVISDDDRLEMASRRRRHRR